MPGPTPVTPHPSRVNKSVVVAAGMGLLGLAAWGVLSGQSARMAQYAQATTAEPLRVGTQPIVLPQAPPPIVAAPTPIAPQQSQGPGVKTLEIGPQFLPTPSRPQQRVQQAPPPPPPKKERQSLVLVKIERDESENEPQNPFLLDSPIYTPSEFSVLAGDTMQVLLQTGIESDLSGGIKGVVARNIYDSKSQQHLLIPQGSIVLGAYAHDVNFGQERVLIVWNRLIFPNKKSRTLGDMDGVDMAGYSGFKDQVNNHILQVFGTALVLSAITTGATYAQQGGNNNNYRDPYGSPSDIAAQQLGQQLGRTSNNLLQQRMNRPPTITVRPGYRCNVMVKKDLEFPSPYPFEGGPQYGREEVRARRRNLRTAPPGTSAPDSDGRTGGGDSLVSRPVSAPIQTADRSKEGNPLAPHARVSKERRLSESQTRGDIEASDERD